MSADRRATLGTVYYLGAIAALFVLLAAVRGSGRVLIPLLLYGLVAYGLHRLVKALRAPVD